MNIKQLRYFAAVVEHGSLSAAAKDQYVTVQAVSKAVADLERELGRDLFVRESRGVHATPFGNAFILKVAPVLQNFTELESFASRYQENPLHADVLRLALCAPPFLGNEEACESIAAFTKKGLGFETQVALDNGEKALSGLRSGVYDMLVTIGPFSSPDTDCISMGAVAPGLIMAKDHPLAREKSVVLADLENYSISLSPLFDAFNDSIATMYQKRDLDIDFKLVSVEHFSKHLLEQQGVTFVTYIPALGALHPETVIRPVATEDALAIPICLVSLKNRKTKAYLAFERWLSGALVIFGGESPGDIL
ncbi:MAG: LysR family transcriptional regulator [Gordonibacter sp.]